MKTEVKVPSVGESITEATIGSWSKKNGEAVKRNEIILLLETDKASVEVVAENDGVLQILADAGKTVKIGDTVAILDSEAKPNAAATPPPPPPPPMMQTAGVVTSSPLSPAVQRIVTEKKLDVSGQTGTGKDGRLTKADVMALSAVEAAAQMRQGALNSQAVPAAVAPAPSVLVKNVSNGVSKQGDKKRVPMTTIRKRIAERLVEAQQTAAILTTFNEVDMTKVIEIRNKYKDVFKEKYNVNLGFMGFFVKAAIEALKTFPAVNAYIIDSEIEYHNYYNIGVAVSTEKGLMVPVIKDADLLSVAGIEMAIRNLATKGRDGKISIDDLNGGTFSITNGGVFGSLLSTPILNPPQSAILGMHKIQDRPMAIQGKVEIRPMMYLALSYDHRIIDGKEAVGFLVKIKEGVEDPERLLLEV